MINDVTKLKPIIPAFDQAERPAPSIPTAEGTNFADVLTGAISDAGKTQKVAEKTTEAFLAGNASIHEVMIAGEKAGISFRYAITLKNKALDAYRELMNTPI